MMNSPPPIRSAPMPPLAKPAPPPWAFPLALAVGLASLLALGGAARAGDATYEGAGATIEQLPITPPRRSRLTRKLGGEKTRVHLYNAQLAHVDDNVFRDAKDRQSDAVHILVVGGQVVRQEDRGSIDLNGYWRHDTHAEFKDLDADDYRVNASGDYRVGERITVEVGGYATRTTDPVTPTATVTLTQDIQSLTATVGYRATEKVGIEAGYSATGRQFADDYRALERVEQAISLTPYYQFSEKTRLRMTGTYGMSRYRRDLYNDLDYIEVRVGGTWQSSDRIQVAGDIGLRSTHYKETGTEEADDDFLGMVWTTAATYRFDSRWSTTLSLLSNPYTNDQGRTIRYRIGSMALGYQPNEKVVIALGPFLDQSKDPEEVKNTGWGGTASIRYMPTDWVGLGAAYKHTRRVTSDNANDYRQNLLTGGAWVVF